MIDRLWPSGMQFATPWALTLIVLPLVILAMELRRGTRAAGLSALPRGGRLPRSWRTRLLWAPPALRCLGLVLLIIALARPQQGIGRIGSSADAVAIELVVDRSGSMAQEMILDGKSMTRLEVVKRVVREFLVGDDSGLAGRPSDLVGVVSFAAFAQTACPPVRDPRTLVQLVDAIPLAQYDYENGTSIGDGLSLAAARLHTAEQDLKNRTDAEQFESLRIKSKVCILLTDGRSTPGTPPPLEAAQLAKDWGIKVYTIGIGAGADSYVVQRTPFGDRRLRVPSDVDEPTLQQIADMTGGLYRRAQDGQALRRIYEEIDQLEKTSVRTVEYVDYSEKFTIFAAIGLGALATAVALNTTVLRRTVA